MYVLRLLSYYSKLEQEDSVGPHYTHYIKPYKMEKKTHLVVTFSFLIVVLLALAAHCIFLRFNPPPRITSTWPHLNSDVGLEELCAIVLCSISAMHIAQS